MSRYKEILVCPEAELLVNKLLLKPDELTLSKHFINSLQTDIKFKNWGLNNISLEDFANCSTNFSVFIRILNIYKQRIKPGANIILFKAVELIGLYDSIIKFSNAGIEFFFISLIRDCRAIFSSQKNTRINNIPINNNPLVTAHHWKEYVKWSGKQKNENNFLIITYEDLIKAPDFEINKLFNLTGLSNKVTINNPAGDLYDRLPNYQKEIHTSIILPPDISKINTWENELSKYEIILIENIAGNQLRALGYDLLLPEINMFKLLILKIYYKLLIFTGINKYY
ncbi:MAG: hypothetical protein AMS27_10730 [Bacteroides sp. SM23_62_1]|nr:MAG: hypothetical protein AMS27_10730 [Bacteroides sp. SM23_62_1]